MFIVVLLVGIGLALVGYVQAILAGFKHDSLWGILNLVFSPIAPLVMAIQGNMRWNPVLLMIGGGLLFFIGGLLGPFEALFWMGGM